MGMGGYYLVEVLDTKHSIWCSNTYWGPLAGSPPALPLKYSLEDHTGSTVLEESERLNMVGQRT